MNHEFPVFLGLFAAGLVVRMVYERLKLAGRVDIRNRLVFAVVFTGMCLMWMGWFGLVPEDPVKVALPGPVKGLGLGITGLGVALAVGAFVQLRGLEDIDRLVTTGLFSRIRHPMYTGFLLWIPGWMLAHGAVASLVPGIAGAAGILYWQRLEEAAVEERFGEAYRTYRRGTWF